MKKILLALVLAVLIVTNRNTLTETNKTNYKEPVHVDANIFEDCGGKQSGIHIPPKPKKTTQRISRGGMGERITCFITYYTNEDSLMEGGQKDKRGRLLTSHGVPVVAMPKDVPYGAKLILDQPLNGHDAIEGDTFKVVDTGGAIRWKNGGVKVDVFVPNVSPQWIEKNLKNKTIQGYLWR